MTPLEDVVKRLVARLNISDEEKEQLVAQLLQEIPRRRQRKQIPAEAQELVTRYRQLREELRQIRDRLKELGLTPAGITVRRGYGDYNYRGTPAYETVKNIIQARRSISAEELEEELKAKGYRGITGTIGVVLKNLKEDGLIRRENGRYVWTGG